MNLEKKISFVVKLSKIEMDLSKSTLTQNWNLNFLNGQKFSYTVGILSLENYKGKVKILHFIKLFPLLCIIRSLIS